MPVVVWANQGDFEAWHDPLCLDLKIPHPGYIQSTGDIALENQWTIAEYQPFKADGQLCMVAPADAIAADATLKQLPLIDIKLPADPGGTVDENGDPITVIEAPGFEVAKPLPDTYVDPKTGIEHDVPKATSTTTTTSKVISGGSNGGKK